MIAKSSSRFRRGCSNRINSLGSKQRYTYANSYPHLRVLPWLIPLEQSETSELVCTVRTFLYRKMNNSSGILTDLAFSLECSVR